MKKLFRSLITLALAAPLLSGCSIADLFSSLPEETKEVNKLDARDYATSAPLNSNYKFEGKVYVVYTDTTEKEVTEYCTFDKVDTSKVGKSTLKVKYETKKVIFSNTFDITVYDPNAKSELESISVSGYTDEVEKGSTYTFDGKVFAKYKGIDGQIEVNKSDCTIGTISTSSTGNKSLSISFTDKYNDAGGVEHTVTKSATATIKVICTPTAISASAIEVAEGRSKQITLSFTPSDATEKEVTYVSANKNVADVDANGNVSGKAAGQSTTITVTSKANPNASTTVNVSVTEVQRDAWTILIYMCGADLESDSKDGGAATEDLKEIASVSGQPDDVNVVVQAGGANSWKSTYSSVINKSYANRFHLNGKTYVKDSQTTKQNMGSSDTLKSFLTWGIEAYPADNYGLIFWNHGGGMDGCCFDEQFDNDGLTPYEAYTGIKAARSQIGMTEKFEFVGYDCCLMEIQDICSLNSEYAKYQVASEEAEWGYGWTYDEWVDDLFAKKSTENILTAIVDSFGTETNSVYSKYGETNDQTLSFVNLANWSTYEDAWEDMASTLSGIVNSKSAWSSLETVLTSCQRFGLVEVDYWGTTDYAYDIFDIGSFITKMKASSTYNGNSTLMSKFTALQSAYSNLVVHEFHGAGASGATGLCLFAPVAGYSYKSSYTSDSTKLSTWRSICASYGTWSS